jgi:hypothetical protein
MGGTNNAHDEEFSDIDMRRSTGDPDDLLCYIFSRQGLEPLVHLLSFGKVASETNTRRKKLKPRCFGSRGKKKAIPYTENSVSTRPGWTSDTRTGVSTSSRRREPVKAF